MRVYLAGPINGCDDLEMLAWRREAMRELALRGLWAFSPAVRDHRKILRPTQGQARRVVEPDLDDIKVCDALLAYCWKPASGTAMEVMHAHRTGKTVVAVIPADAPCSPWIVYHAHHVVETLEESYDLLGGVKQAASW